MANVALHRDKIIQATVRLYREKGYSSTGLSEILKISGAPKGSLYYYFPGGKDELTLEAISLAGSVVENTLKDLASKSDDITDFIESYCQLLAGWMEASRFKAGCPIATTVLETVPNSPTITKRSREVFGQWIKIIASVFEKSGFSEVVANTQAENLIAAVEGSLLLSRVKLSPQPILNIVKLFNLSILKP